MRTITKLQTLLVLFLTTAMVCFMGCKDDDDDVPTPGGGGTVATYAISGTVMDASNNPMIGVSVALSGAQSLSATTGSDGTYSFDLKSTPGSTCAGHKIGRASCPAQALTKSPLSRKAM